MPSLITRFSMVARAAIAAWRNGESSSAIGDSARARLNLLWAYYTNSVFEDIAAWQSYRSNYVLYHNIRSVYNPTRRLVNFYVAQVYPGVLSEDGSNLPDGVQLAVPLSADTEDELKTAIAQFWQWSNWQSGNKLMVRYGAATGSCLVEIVDNVERGKITTAVRWPGLLADKAKDEGPSLVLDDTGNVKFYALEYDAVDETGNTYKYRKEVSQETFRYYKEDTLMLEEDNPYGFVPAVWCKHVDEGWGFGESMEGEQIYGAPAISGSLGKIDELNGLVSHDHDQVDRLIESPGIIASSATKGNIATDAAALRRATVDEYSDDTSVKSKPTRRLMLKGPADTKWVPLVGNLDPEKVVPLIDRLLAELERDFPELGMYQELRKMSQVTGPGAARMMGDVYSRVLEVSSNYDQQSIKLFQMAVAIGGMRLKEGKEGWAQKTDQRLKFGAFDLDSYQNGDLNMAIMPRPLIPETEDDTITLTGKRLENASKAQGIFNDDKVLEIAGVSDEDERVEILREREKESLAAPAAARGLNPPPGVKGLLEAASGKGLR